MATERVVLSLQSVTKALAGGRVVLEDVTLGFLAGAKIGILGINGAGKSTLLGILAGEDKEFTGERKLEGGISSSVSIGYLPQEPMLDENKSVEQVIVEGLAHKKGLLDEFDAITARLGDEGIEEETMTQLLEQQAVLQEKIDAEDAWDLSREIAIASEALRCPEGATAVKVLSGGEKRRVALCRLLLAKPNILLLDEPTNHLDAETVAWLERHLRESDSTVVLVTHDRYFLDNVTGWMLELDRGRALPHHGNYSSWLAARARRLAEEEREDKVLLRAIEEERAWMGKSRVARRERAKARIKSYEERLQAAQEVRPDVQRIAIPPGARLGSKTVVAEGVSKSFGDRLLFEALSFSLPQGGIVGVIGANGAGKTTLFRLITGEEKVDRGELAFFCWRASAEACSRSSVREKLGCWQKGSGVCCHAWLSVWCCSVHRSILRTPFSSVASRLSSKLTFHRATTGCLRPLDSLQTMLALVFFCRCCSCVQRFFGRKGQSHGTVSSHSAFFVLLQRMAARIPARGPKYFCFCFSLSEKISS